MYNANNPETVKLITDTQQAERSFLCHFYDGQEELDLPKVLT